VQLPPLPLAPPPPSNLMTTNASSFIGLNRMSPLPMRRYSYSGLPSSTSFTDLNMNFDAALLHSNSSITNLINETCQSISRSSNILSRQLSADMALGGYGSMSFTNLIDENVESDIVKFDLLNEITTTAPVAPLKYSDTFYSHPTRHLPVIAPSYFNRNVSHVLSSDDYLLSKPIFSKSYVSHPMSSSYISDDHGQQYSNNFYGAQPLTHSYHTTPPSHLHYPTYTHHQLPLQHRYHPHYASNPCLSTHSYHNAVAPSVTATTAYPNSLNHSALNSAFNRTYNYPSQLSHQQAFSSSRPPSISSLNRYTTALSNNYTNSFNAQPYYRTSSRIDLDNPKGSEIKRQVSFKFDVDQMSYDQ
jgi:hypothetical protein